MKKFKNTYQLLEFLYQKKKISSVEFYFNGGQGGFSETLNSKIKSEALKKYVLEELSSWFYDDYIDWDVQEIVSGEYFIKLDENGKLCLEKRAESETYDEEINSGIGADVINNIYELVKNQGAKNKESLSICINAQDNLKNGLVIEDFKVTDFDSGKTYSLTEENKQSILNDIDSSLGNFFETNGYIVSGEESIFNFTELNYEDDIDIKTYFEKEGKEFELDLLSL